jgi:hypothetical protein
MPLTWGWAAIAAPTVIAIQRATTNSLNALNRGVHNILGQPDLRRPDISLFHQRVQGNFVAVTQMQTIPVVANGKRGLFCSGPQKAAPWRGSGALLTKQRARADTILGTYL